MCQCQSGPQMNNFTYLGYMVAKECWRIWYDEQGIYQRRELVRSLSMPMKMQLKCEDGALFCMEVKTWTPRNEKSTNWDFVIKVTNMSQNKSIHELPLQVSTEQDTAGSFEQRETRCLWHKFVVEESV